MKILEITLNNYRAFYNEKGRELTKHKLEFKGKKNLLIYGENGSGKSSVYKGLLDFLQSSIRPEYTFIKNVFSKEHEPDELPFIEVVFEGTSESFKFSDDPHSLNTAVPFIKTMARTKSFISYHNLLKIHLIDSPKVNLFDFLFSVDKGILTTIPNPSSSQTETNVNIGKLLELVQSSPDSINIKDYVNGVKQILEELGEILNNLLGYFDKSLSVSFIPLTEDMIRDENWAIGLNVKYFGIDLDNTDVENYHHFLNEARLTALAISIFLAANLSLPTASHKMLFLDDIFTGLDNSNRMPLLDILTAEIIKGTDGDTFTKHQILLTTYDRHWFELARNHLGTKDWIYQEMFIDRHSQKFDQPVLKPSKDSFEMAAYYFQMHHYPACANYQRKICEGLIKQFLPKHKKYDTLPNGDIKPVDKLATLIDRFQIYMSDHGLDFTPFNKLKNCLKVVMNPLSHDDLESPAYRRELELVFDIIEELRKLKNEEIIKQGAKLIIKKTHGKNGKEFEYEFEVQTSVRSLETGNSKKSSKILVRPLKMVELPANKEKKLGYETESLDKALESVLKYLEITDTLDPLDEFFLQDGENLKSLKSIIGS